MKEFTIAAKAAVEPDEVLKPVMFKVDDDEVRAYPPSPGQVAVMFTSLSEYAEDRTKVAGTVDFFFGLLDEDSRKMLTRRLMDRSDPFELEQITEIMGWLVEQWAARPLPSSSGSTPSPRATGRTSTGRSRNGASTRSITALTDSAT